jgi:TIR domain
MTATFVSHSSKDSAAAAELCTALEARGVPCWIAPRDVTAGAEYADEIMRGIERSATMVVLVSQHSNGSSHVLREIEQAVRLGKPIFPLFLEDVRLTKRLDYYIAPIHWLHVGRATLDQRAATLKRAIERDDDWRGDAIAPSLARSMRLRPLRTVAAPFAGSLLAGILLLSGAYAWLSHKQAAEQRLIDLHPDSLGFVALSGGELRAGSAEGAAQVDANISLYGQQTRYSDVNARIATFAGDALVASRDITAELNDSQVGGGQMLRIALDLRGDRVVTCLSMPHPRLKDRYRVTQRFALTGTTDSDTTRFAFIRSSSNEVAPEKDQPCQ